MGARRRTGNTNYDVLTELMRMFGSICVVFVIVFVAGESLLVPVSKWQHVPPWLMTLLRYAVRYALGFAAGSGMIALLFWQQRSEIPR